MDTNIPYMFYLSFKKMTDAKSLFDLMKFFQLVDIGEESVDDEVKIVKFCFKSDSSQKIVFYVIVQIKTDECENINIALSMDTEVDKIKELFSFLENLGSDNYTLMDQEIKNQLYWRDQEKFQTLQEKTVIPTSWINDVEQQASISINFDDFWYNNFKLTRRDKLLRK